MAETVPEDFRELTTGKGTRLYTQTTELEGIQAIDPRAGIPDITSDGASDRELITISEMDYESSFPEVRTNIGESHFSTHGSPDIGLPFIAEGDNETKKFFFDRHSVNPTTRELRVFPWLFRTRNQKGEDLEFTFRAKLTQMRVRKSRGEQGELITVFGLLRVIDMVPVIKRMNALYFKSVSISSTALTLTFNKALEDGTAAGQARNRDSYFFPGLTLARTNPIAYTAAQKTVTLNLATAPEAGTYAITARGSLKDSDGTILGRDQTRSLVVS